jgi:hypothetical protein
MPDDAANVSRRIAAGVRLNRTIKGGINNFNVNIWTMRGAISITQAPSRGPSGTPTRAPTQVPTARPTEQLACSSFDGQNFAVRRARVPARQGSILTSRHACPG